jgi:hypothetical protein
MDATGETYDTKSTSRSSAAVGDKTLSETTTTRTIIRPVVVTNPHNPDASVKVELLHQRKNKNDFWEDEEKFKLSSLKAQQIVNLTLDSKETVLF